MGPSPVEPAGGERRRYVRAFLAGLAIVFVLLVAAPQSPPTYVLGIGFFVVAIVIVWGHE